MNSRKLCAIVTTSLVVLAMSLPVMAQDITQSTTTTRTPDQPTTKSTRSYKTKTKYNRHHRVKETKVTQKTKTRTTPGADHMETTTTTRSPQK